MRVKLLKHDIVMNVKEFDEKTKVVTIKFFGTDCKFQEHEYEIVENDDECSKEN